MAADSSQPPARFLPRWLFYLLLPGLVLPILILGFIFVSELAHDEARCPYIFVSEKHVRDNASVREDVRRCLPGVEERRFTAQHGAKERVLGRRRFARSAFEPGEYSWEPAISEQGELSVTVHNAGHGDAVFREGTSEERGE